MDSVLVEDVSPQLVQFAGRVVGVGVGRPSLTSAVGAAGVNRLSLFGSWVRFVSLRIDVSAFARRPDGSPQVATQEPSP